MRGVWFGVALLGLMVSGCGGDDGGSVAPPTSVAPTPTPTPAPTPTPTPTPPPAPTPPSASYPVAFDFSRDRTFNLIGVQRLQDLQTLILGDSAAAQLTYTVANQETQLSINGLGRVFPASQISVQNGESLGYSTIGRA